MKIQHAYLCISCSEVNDRAPRGVCNVCGSASVYPLSRALAEDPFIVGADLRVRPSDGPTHRSAPTSIHPLNGGRRPLAERL